MRAEVEPPAAGRDSGPVKVVAGLLVPDGKTEGRLRGDPRARAFLARFRIEPVELAVVGGHQHIAVNDGGARPDGPAGAKAPERLAGAGVERVQRAVVGSRDHRSRGVGRIRPDRRSGIEGPHRLHDRRIRRAALRPRQGGRAVEYHRDRVHGDDRIGEDAGQRLGRAIVGERERPDPDPVLVDPGRPEGQLPDVGGRSGPSGEEPVGARSLQHEGHHRAFALVRRTGNPGARKIFLRGRSPRLGRGDARSRASS